MHHNEIIKEALESISKSYSELSKILKCELSDKSFDEIMKEVVRISVNEIARHMLRIKYPEIDDLPDKLYTLVNELIPAFLEKYVLDRVGLGGRDLSEVTEELSLILNTSELDEGIVEDLYEEFESYLDRGEIDEFMKIIIRKASRLVS